MLRLASPIEKINDHYSVVVVGSGYGGAIMASRLARAGCSVCVLERGREFQPGEFPDTPLEVSREFQTDLVGEHIGDPAGLYDLHAGRDINVLRGCGLGGTSLINANVSLRPDPRIFADHRWPVRLRGDLAAGLEEGFGRAEQMLRPVPYPDDFPVLSKLKALEQSAQKLGARFYRPPLNVTFKAGPNAAGIDQAACVLCGDCVSGCNYGAKNTLPMNYLPDARAHGAELYTQTRARWVERAGNGWLVHYHVLGAGREQFGADELTVHADMVVLSAGALGSTEILLRSRERGLATSDRLGERFSGNGDFVAFAYNSGRVINGVGLGRRRGGGHEAVGPCIAGVIDLRNQSDFEKGLVIEDGSPPGAIGDFLPPALAGARAAAGKDSTCGFAALLAERGREIESLTTGPYQGAIRNTQTFLVMGHDDAGGRMALVKDRLRIDWPKAGASELYERIRRTLMQAAAPLGGTFVPNVLWEKLHGNLTTVHPLGGCVMADDAAQGVVNDRGQVFSAPAGDTVYENLYVCDSSVIPRPLGVNPLLTISALAERCAALAAARRGCRIDYGTRTPRLAVSGAARLGIRFTEAMRGHFSAHVKDDYERGAQQGKAEGSPFEFTLTIASEDLEAMLTEPGHTARMVGTAMAPALSPRPLTATGGRFNLLVTDPERVDTRNMRYRMNLETDDGRSYFFEGLKIIRNDSAFDVWKDTTTLYTTIYDGPTPEAGVLGKGILRITPPDFLRQLTTLEVTNAPGAKERLEAQARFGRFFAGTLWQTYGDIFAGPAALAPDTSPRKRRPLRTHAPEVHFFKTTDNVKLRLVRYQGGTKGPVILSHGLGVSSAIFTIDTIETNLVEYLTVHGFDVWLLDHRASIELPASAGEFTADDIALRDYPAAVAVVRQATGAASVQMVVHCFGATTFAMAMLAGLEAVRSAVFSQVATHLVTPPVTSLKCGLHLPDLLDSLGIKSLSAYAGSHPDWKDRLFDLGLRFSPTPAAEECTNPVCHRITFLYSLLYEHAQLNSATHEALSEMFGMANVRCFEHLGRMVRAGHIVSADGQDVYLGHLKRLAIPISFIHGARNQCFLPASTEITYRLLGEANGSSLYSRHVVGGYGHIDCIFGKDAARDVYPLMLRHLEATL